MMGVSIANGVSSVFRVSLRSASSTTMTGGPHAAIAATIDATSAHAHSDLQRMPYCSCGIPPIVTEKLEAPEG
jgi:hypothetical protein